jgi:hypothetical protein
VRSSLPSIVASNLSKFVGRLLSIKFSSIDPYGGLRREATIAFMSPFVTLRLLNIAKLWIFGLFGARDVEEGVGEA